jgi:hemoglobin/transferrin/lactoferrin receptor protein
MKGVKNMQKTVPTLLITSLLLCPMVAAHAQEQELKQTTDEVKVTATKVERPIEEVPYSVENVTAEEIQRKAVSTIADTLRDIPGVVVTDGSMAGAKRISIRGETGARVLILIDGQKISEQKSMDGSIYMIDPAIVERVEVIKGPASVLYGSEAIGGVVNIITKKAGSRPVQIEAGITFDSSTNGLKENISLFGKIDRVGYRLYGSFSDQQDRKAPGGTLDNTAFREMNGKAYLDYQWDNATAAFTYEKFKNKLSVYTPPGTTSSTMPYFYQDLPDWSREKYAVSLDLRKLPAPLVKVTANAFYQNTLKDFIMDMDVNPPGPAYIQTRNQTKNDLDTLGVQLQADWLLFSDHYVVTGFDFNKDWLIADETRRRRALPGPGLWTTTLYKDKAESDVYALYAQDEWNFAKDFILTAGLRQTWVSTALTSATDPLLKIGSNSDNNLVGSVGLTWNGLKNTSLRMLFAQGYRNATLQQLYMGTVHGSTTPTYGNQDLKPEESMNIEFGIRYKHKGFNLDTALFGSETKNLITTMNHPTIASAKIFGNVNKAYSYGIDSSLGYSFEDLGLTPYASISYLQRRFESATLKTWKTDRPAVQGRVGLQYENNKSGKLGYYLDLYGRFADAAEYESAPNVIDRTPGWVSLNTSAGLTFGSNRQHKLSLNLNNLLDKRFSTSTESIPMAGRSVVVSLNVAF